MGKWKDKNCSDTQNCFSALTAQLQQFLAEEVPKSEVKSVSLLIMFCIDCFFVIQLMF